MLIKPAQSLIERARNENMTYPFFRFPENLGSHVIVMNFKEYRFESGGGLVNSVSEIPKGAIVLPIPTNLQDTFDVTVSGQEIGIGGKATSTATDALSTTNTADVGTEAAKAIGGFARNLLTFNTEELKKDASVLVDFSRYMIRGSLARINLNTSLSIGRGTVINPHMAIAFEGMQLKNHTFSWRLSPKNSTESDRLRQIQNYIKRSALPSYEDSDGSTGLASKSIFKYPNVVDIFFLGIDQEYFYYFKRCMVSNFSTNYSPAGQHSFLKGGRPAMVEMNMELMETEVHTSEDYSEDVNG